MAERHFFISILFLGIVFFMSGPALAAEGFFSADSQTEKEPWEIEARELNYDKDTEIYTAIGEVVIKKGNKVLKCDFAKLYNKTLIAEARGQVEYISNGDELRGEELTIDLKNQNGEVKNGRLFVKQNNFYITGEKLWKTGEASYRILNGSFTSCEGEDVPWKITAKDLMVTVEGYGEAWGSSFRVKNTPILYSPYIIFPVKTKRQSGLLFPEPGYSNRDGVSLYLPFYWAISDSLDATFSAFGMSSRGYLQGAEFRYAASPLSKGTFMFDYLFKDLISDQEYQKGNIAEPYTQRYWFRGKANQLLPGKVDLKVDFDLVSDRDYLREFRSLPNGLDRNRPYFVSEFNRDLDDETMLDRRNSALFTRGFGNYTLYGGFLFYQDLGKTNTALNQLPFARFDGIRHRLGDLFFFQWNSSYTNYWRKELDYGQVLDLNPTLSLPYKFANYLNTDTSIGLRETLYQVGNKQNDAFDSSGARTVPYLRMDFSTDIQKIFDFPDWEVQKIKHTIRPQVVYDYTPDIKQDSLPTFVPLWTKTNLITYSLTNTFTAKSLIGKGKQEEDLFGYLDFLYFRLRQSYDYNEAQREVRGIDERRPFSDIVGEVELLPGQYFSLRSALGWSVYTNQLNSQSHTLALFDRKGSQAFLEYQTLNGNQIKQLNTSFVWKINAQWSANFINKHSFDQNLSFETTIGLSYTDPCWGIKAYYTGTPDDQKFFIAFSLKGLGDLGF